MTGNESHQNHTRSVVLLGDHETLAQSEMLEQQAALHDAIIIESHTFGLGEARSTGTLHEVPGVVEALGRAIELRAHIWVPFPIGDLTREQHIRRLDLMLERHGLNLLLGRHLTACPEIGVNSVDFALRAEVHAVDQLDQAALASAGLRTLAGEIEMALFETVNACQLNNPHPGAAGRNTAAPSQAEYLSSPRDSESGLTLVPAWSTADSAAEQRAHRRKHQGGTELDTPPTAARPAPRSTAQQPIQSPSRRANAMSTAVTANVMIGAIRPGSVHGQPSEDCTPRPFAPSHVMVLMEGHRPTWILQRCPNLGRPSPTLRIRPSSPPYLLAAAILGYVALTQPRIIRESEQLRRLVEVDDRRGEARIHPLDEHDARQIFQRCSEHTFGLITTLPGSTITSTELCIAADTGLQIAAVAPGITKPSATV